MYDAHRKISEIQSQMDTHINTLNQQEEEQERTAKTKKEWIAIDNQCKKFQRKREQLYRSIENKTGAVIEKASDFLSEFRHVAGPKLPVKELVSKERSNPLDKSVKSVLLGWSHATFFNKIMSKSRLKGHSFSHTCEAYSTQMCSRCFYFSKPGRSRIFKCSNSECRAVLGRDENASVSIMLLLLARLRKYMNRVFDRSDKVYPGDDDPSNGGGSSSHGACNWGDNADQYDDDNHEGEEDSDQDDMDVDDMDVDDNASDYDHQGFCV